MFTILFGPQEDNPLLVILEEVKTGEKCVISEMAQLLLSWNMQITRIRTYLDHLLWHIAA